MEILSSFCRRFWSGKRLLSKIRVTIARELPHKFSTAAPHRRYLLFLDVNAKLTQRTWPASRCANMGDPPTTSVVESSLLDPITLLLNTDLLGLDHTTLPRPIVLTKDASYRISPSPYRQREGEGLLRSEICTKIDGEYYDVRSFRIVTRGT